MTFSGPSMIRNNNSRSISVDLWQTDIQWLWTFHVLHKSQVRALAFCFVEHKRSWKFNIIALPKRYLLIKKKEQRMNYCQRPRRVLILALVQMYSMREQSTLRHISQSVFCSTRHGTKLTKHCEMYSNYSFYNPQLWLKFFIAMTVLCYWPLTASFGENKWLFLILTLN